MLVNKDKIIQDIRKKQNEIVEQNKQLLARGNVHEYQCNCNILKGMAKAKEIVDRII